MARNRATQHVPTFTRATWTGRLQPWTAGNKAIHEEIANEQVVHWSKAQIKAAEQSGYFDNLRQRAMKNLKLSLLSELTEEEE